jgi:hypothetical protein
MIKNETKFETSGKPKGSSQCMIPAGIAKKISGFYPEKFRRYDVSPEPAPANTPRNAGTDRVGGFHGMR